MSTVFPIRTLSDAGAKLTRQDDRYGRLRDSESESPPSMVMRPLRAGAFHCFWVPLCHGLDLSD